jgi:ABC-type bacteriocin/lantibiotic exporter with double-glycine peptidase domain
VIYSKQRYITLQRSGGDPNLNIEPGLKVAVVGKSGSGKSTLAKLLAGLYEPTSGKIFFDDIESTKLQKSHIRKQMGIVPQDMFLFNKTILDNITLEDKNIDIDRVKEVCKLVQIDEEIESMPMSYNTILTELGQNLSGGQRQRIILARALIANPKILIFDEATSCLDNINESTISELLSKIGCTRIIIAHRLSTIIDSDHIIVMENGKIVAQGTHEFLLKNSEEYKKLYITGNKK